MTIFNRKIYFLISILYCVFAFVWAGPIYDFSTTLDTPGTYTLQSSISSNVGHGVFITSSDVILDLGGFTIDGLGGDAVDLAGRYGVLSFSTTSPLTNITVKNGTIQGFGVGTAIDQSGANYYRGAAYFAGITLANGEIIPGQQTISNVSIINITSQDNSAWWFDATAGLVFQNNDISHDFSANTADRCALWMLECHNAIVSNNNFHDCGEGLVLWGSDSVLFSFNTVNNCMNFTHGLPPEGSFSALGAYGTLALVGNEPYGCHDVEIRNNVFINNGGNASPLAPYNGVPSIALHRGSVGTIIESNEIHDNPYGGIFFTSTSPTQPVTGAIINYNNIYSNGDSNDVSEDVGLAVGTNTTAVDAQFNYWGSPSGPGFAAGAQNGVSGVNIDTSNWLLYAGGFKSIGASGGTVSIVTSTTVNSKYSKNQVVIPAAALSSDTLIIIRSDPDYSTDPNAYVANGTELLPSGLSFSSPVTITLEYDPTTDLYGYLETDVVLKKWNTGTGLWEIVPGSTVNTVDNTVSGTVTSFSIYGAIPLLTVPVELSEFTISIEP